MRKAVLLTLIFPVACGGAYNDHYISKKQALSEQETTPGSGDLEVEIFGAAFMTPTAGIQPLIPDGLTLAEIAPGLSYTIFTCATYKTHRQTRRGRQLDRILEFDEFAVYFPLLDPEGGAVEANNVNVMVLDTTSLYPI